MSYGVGLRNGVAFALGTIPSLTSGGGLRPSLLLNFLSGSLDPRITFSRGTQAMQYGSDGTLQYAPNNLLTYSNQADNAAWTKSNSFVQTNLVLWSQDFDNAAWTKSLATVSANAITAPDGTLTADLITPTGQFGGVLSTITGLTIGAQYTYSFWAKSNTNTNVLTFRNDTAGTNIGTYTPTSDWVRYSFTFTAAGTSAALWPIQDRNASGFGSTYVWGAQLVQGSVPGDYVATTSAALPVLYADYNGVLRARKLCEDSSNSTHNFNENAGTVGNTETLSFYAKSGERSWAISQLGGSHLAYFDLTNGVLGNVSGGATATIVASGSGWYRCTLTAPRALNTSNFIYCTTGNAVSTYSGNGSSGIYIADAQLTPGYLPLAVTETTSAAVYGPRFDYDPSSLVAQNLLTYSEQFDNAVWNKSTSTIIANAIAAPNGTLTADKLVATALNATHSVSQSGISSTVATLSFYAKAAEETVVSGWLVSASVGAVFDLSTGIATLASATSCGMDAVGNGWYRCWVYASTATTNGFIYLRNGTGYLGDGVSGAYIWGAQINRGSSMLPYTATTTAPYTLTTARGLLIEEQRTNLLLQSNDFLTSWTPTNITRTLNSTLSPEGVVNGVKIEATAALSTVLFQSATVAATAATGSVYVKQGTGASIGNEFTLRNGTTLTNLVRGTLNYTTGVFTYTVGSSGVVVRNVGNGWWRIEMSASAGITAGDSLLWYVGWGGQTAAAGDFFYAYGAQLEAGAFATSYIPTVGSTATRNADSPSITTLTPWFNAAAGTLYSAFDVIAAANGGGMAIASLDNNTVNGYLLYKGVSTATMSAYAGANNASIGSVTANVVAKAAVAYDGTNNAGTLNGAAPSAIVAAAVTTPTQLEIGRTFAGNQLSGHIQSIRYYPTRLPNASLQSITA